MSAVHTELLEYGDEEIVYEAYLAYEEASNLRRPCVLLLHAWAGLCDHERRLARELAQLGYVAAALDLYGKHVRGDPLGDNDALMRPLVEDRELLSSRLEPALEAVKGHPLVDAARIAAVGHCFGGLCALDLARNLAPGVLAAVSFHGMLQPPPAVRREGITAKILILHGYEDPFAPPASLQAIAEELSARGADWQVHVFGAVKHAFTFPEAAKPKDGILYDPPAARRSWAIMKDFLAEVLLSTPAQIVP